MRQFTPRQLPADITVKLQEHKSDPEVSLNHDDLYARAWEYDFEQPIFDAENDNAVPPNQREIPVQSDFQRRKWGTRKEPHTSVPQKLFPQQTKLVT